MKINKIIFIIFLFFAAQRIYMSQVGFINITLDDMIKSSDAVLLAEKNDPFITIKKIRFFSLPWKKCPPYDKYIHNYKIIDIISNKKNITLDNNIKVIDAYFETDLSIYEKMCKENMGISVIYKQYDTSINIKNENRIIIFINKTEKIDEFKYTVKSAYESENEILKIKKILSIKNKYLQIGKNEYKSFIIKAADINNSNKYKTFGINEFMQNKNNKFLFHIIIPNKSRIKKISIQTDDENIELPLPAYIYKMKTSPLITHFIIKNNKYYKLNFLDNNGSILYFVDLEQYKDILQELPVRIENIKGYLHMDYDHIPY